MAFKFAVLFACVMVASAGLLPLQSTVLTKTIEPLDAPAKYDFSYQVNDPTTGDIKSQEESRDGDVLKGAYTLIDADGLQRIVQYTSDGINGFNAIVSRTPVGKQVAVAPVIKAVQPTLIKGFPSIIQPAIAKIGLPSLSPIIKTSPLGLPISPLGLNPLIG